MNRKRPQLLNSQMARAKCFTAIKRAMTMVKYYLDRSQHGHVRTQLGIVNRELERAMRHSWLEDKKGMFGPFMRRAEAAEWLGVSVDAIKSYEAHDHFRTVKLESGLVLVDCVSFNEWLASREVLIPDELRKAG